MSLTFPALLGSVSAGLLLAPHFIGVFVCVLLPKCPSSVLHQQELPRNLGLNLWGSLRQLWAGILSAQEFIRVKWNLMKLPEEFALLRFSLP